jgi:hypothetical protein
MLNICCNKFIIISNDFGSYGFPVKSAPAKSALVKSAPSQIGLKMKVKSDNMKQPAAILVLPVLPVL